MLALLAAATALATAPAVAGAAEHAGADTDGRVGDVLELDGEREDGRIVFEQTAAPSCGTCHQLGAVGARGQLGPSLDEMQPRREAVVRAIVGGEIEIHERQGFSDHLSDEQVADLATFVSEASVDPVARLDVPRALGTSPWVGVSIALAAIISLLSVWYAARIVLELVRRGRDA